MKSKNQKCKTENGNGGGCLLMKVIVNRSSGSPTSKPQDFGQKVNKDFGQKVKKDFGQKRKDLTDR